MRDNITGLVIFRIRRYLEYQILRKFVPVVTYMQPGEVNIV